jgi:hypothetical protein
MSQLVADKPTNLRITEEQFNEIYPDLVGHYDWFNTPPPPGITKERFEQTYLKSKLWRINNIYKIVNKDGNAVVFRMNYAQHKVYAATRLHSRVIILKSRQQGISTLWLVSYFDDAVFGKLLNIGLMAQGTDEASTLLERAKFLWDNLNQSIKAFMNVRLTKDNTKEFAFSNKCTMFIRVSFRSTTLQRLHISEFGKIANANPKRANETKTGTLQALGKGNTGVIESTAEGRNEFKFMWDSAQLVVNSGQMSPKDFYPVFLSWLDDPDCLLDVPQAEDKEAREYFEELEQKLGVVVSPEQRNFWIAQRRELGGDIFQEYPATPEEAFTAARDGTYYSRLFNESCVRKGRVRTDMYDPNIDTEVYLDLGVSDYFVVIFVQWWRGEWRIIDEYWNNNYALTHYVDVIEGRGYRITNYNCPHDMSVRELGSGGYGGLAKSREDMLREYFTAERISANITILPKTGIEAGIEATRRMIPRMAIDPKCEYIIDCLNNYSKEWDDNLRVWKKTPRHDEYSHGADVLRQIAVNSYETDKPSLLDSSRPRRTPRGHAV